MGPQNSKKWIWIAVGIIAIGIIVWLLSMSDTSNVIAPNTADQTSSRQSLGADDTTASIEQQLNATDLGSFEAELQTTNADVNSL